MEDVYGWVCVCVCVNGTLHAVLNLYQPLTDALTSAQVSHYMC